MSARARKKGNGARRRGWWESFRLAGLLATACAGYLLLALSAPTPPWLPVLRGEEPLTRDAWANPGGPVGTAAAFALRAAFGLAWAWAVPLALLGAGLWRLATGRGGRASWLWRAGGLWLASSAWLAQSGFALGPGEAAAWGGAAGLGLAHGFRLLFGLWGSRILLSVLLVIVLAWAFWPVLEALGVRLAPLGRALSAVARGVGWLGRGLGRGALAAFRAGGRAAARGATGLARVAGRAVAGAAAAGGRSEAAAAGAGGARSGRRLHLPAGAEQPAPGAADADPAVAAAAGTAGGAGRRPEGRRAEGRAAGGGVGEAPAGGNGGAGGGPAGEGAALPARTAARGRERSAAAGGAGGAARPGGGAAAAPGPVALPSLSLLRDPAPEAVRQEAAALEAQADLLESTLRSFGVEGEVKDVRPGPVVTTFEYQPATGIKVAQIVQRVDDLALALRARSLRLEAPIPGKAAVGVEIPNPSARIVTLKEVMAAAGDRMQGPLAVALGQDVVGQPVVLDVAGLPHLLVAGSTGSGKSVCLNALIATLLLRNDPSRVRLVLIDPKMLEMSVYNGIPHLLLPVVTDPKEALRALKWMEAQMDRRYRQLARYGVRNIEAFNARVARGEVVDEDGQPVTEPMPYYLTIVDELADLMLQLGQEFELPITRLAQKARAVGIHLILATQRPSVDVLTGVIKANIPCRIAFRVIQKNDSRTILDMNGAERLLGHGDMLYLQPGRATPVRVHGAYLDIAECEAIVTHWRQYAHLTTPLSLGEERGEGGSDHTGEDDLFEAARRVVVLHQSGSTSLLQRRLRIGYTRAGRLMDMLEEAGVVGPFTGSKARDVLLRPEDLGEDGADLRELEEEE